MERRIYYNNSVFLFLVNKFAYTVGIDKKGIIIRNFTPSPPRGWVMGGYKETDG